MARLEAALDMMLQGPAWSQALVLFALTILLAFVLEWMFGVTARTVARRTKTDLDNRMLDLLRGPIRNTVLIYGLSLSLRTLPFSETFERVVLDVGTTLVIFIWTMVGIRLISLLLRSLESHSRFGFFQRRTVPLFDSIQKIVLFGGASYMALLTWDIDLTAWIASAGIAGLAIGFAAKDTLANLFSGVFILADAPYKIGDMIQLDSGERGRVTDVGIRSTRVLTRDDVEIIIPNSAIGAAKIANESGGPYRKRRLDIRVGVAYSSDIEVVRRALTEVSEELDVICKHPEPRVRFRSFDDSALTFSLLFWIDNPEDRGLAIDAANSLVLEKFRASGVEIPFPQRDVHFASGAPPGRG